MKNVVTILVVLLLLAVAAMYYGYPSLTTDTEKPGQTTTEMDDAIANEDTTTAATVPSQTTENNPLTADEAAEAEARAIFADGQPRRCTFTSTVDGEESSGTIYTDGERTRIESLYETEGETYTSGVLGLGDETYNWSQFDGQTRGMIIPVQSVLDSATATEEAAVAGNVDPALILGNSDINYSCERWTIDEALFVPPRDIEFQTVEDLMQMFSEETPQMEAEEAVDADASVQ